MKSLVEMIEYASENYPKGMSLSHIAKKFKMSSASVRYHLLKNNIHVRSVREHHDMMLTPKQHYDRKYSSEFEQREISININIPEDDISLSCVKDDVYDSMLKMGGIYKFYNNKHELLYIGKSYSLPARINQHINGKSNTSDVCHNFHRVSCIYISDESTRSLVEIYLINKLKPKLNLEYVSSYKSERYEELYQTQ